MQSVILAYETSIYSLKKLEEGVEIIEAECCPDHVHMPVTIPPPHISI